jgi:glycosyltransferase involved in cell wall biosynthesis
LPSEAHVVASTHCLIGLVHHPLALETGLSEAAVEALRASETQALAATRHVIVTDHSTAALLAADYGVQQACTTVALPGAPRVPWAQGANDGIVNILAVGAVVPRKGYDLLVAALANMQDLPWHLTFAGDRARSPQYVVALDRMVSRNGLARRISCTGAVPDARLAALYQGADIFVQASWFEGYGMALADGIAYGLPVVATQTGAASTLVASQTGLLVPPGDESALGAALRALIGDAELRAHYRCAARAKSTKLPSWEDTANAFEHVLTRLM